MFEGSLSLGFSTSYELIKNLPRLSVMVTECVYTEQTAPIMNEACPRAAGQQKGRTVNGNALVCKAGISTN